MAGIILLRFLDLEVIRESAINGDAIRAAALLEKDRLRPVFPQNNQVF